jgi:DNA-binding NtrC family response regulator
MAKSTILVVDKEKILVDLLIRALSSDDVAAFGTTSAQEALRLLDMNAPSLVVFDPTVSNGSVLLDAVVRSGSKVVAVCGSTETVERVRAAGLSEIVDRNAGLDVLVASIRRLVDAPIKVMGGEGGVPVLVVDDEDEIRNVLCEFLAAKGYCVQTGKNGFDAVNTVNQDPAVQVVLLDVSMPQMGGMEALRHIMDRDNPPSVIMMTAVADREVARQALKTGAFDYILKPFDFASIDASIIACLSQKEFKKQPWWKRLSRRQ